MYGSPGILGRPYKTGFVQLLPEVIFNTFLISLFYFLHFYFLKYIKFNEIQILNQQTEIENLKQQLNPHFLLNSLNNLYSVSLTKPEAVSDKIVELSDLLKYQIETCKKDYISLFEEQKFIEKYIAYSQWKLQNITINTEEKGISKNYKVTPMIFLPLLENAVKYANFEKNPVININWEYNDSKFTFSITNAYQESKKEHFSTKIGLKNLKKRIKLFHPNSKLEIIDVNSNFKVIVSLWNLDILA
jgi:LytS/YehU family sensor histidine kinase